MRNQPNQGALRATMRKRWDNIEILHAIDRIQERYGGGPVTGMNGMYLMDEINGGQVTEPNLWRGFVQELHIARDLGLLIFRADSNPRPNLADTDPYYYLQTLSNFALTVSGQDRARGTRIVLPLPDPDEDDGRPISSLILQQVGEAIEANYSREQLVTFLRESEVPIDDLPALPANGRIDTVHSVLIALDQWGSEGRRALRCFVGSWLDDRLVSGPGDELRSSLIEQLARQGWYVQDGRLVIGEPARGRRVSRPVLRDARLAALHPEIVSASEGLLKSGHRTAAVFEAAKAVNNRVKAMTRLPGDGAGLMGQAFSSDKPRLILGDLSTATGRDVQDGYRFLFMGAQQAIRNPAAHEPFGDIDDDEAFELLGLASQLMRRLDSATRALQ
jgi:uncharacterized protein (TIGR02391 family)